MDATYLYMAIVIGAAISLMMSEIIGINPGGMIVPGYMALICDDIAQVLIIFAVSVIVYLIVNHVLPRFIILYGRRKFVATIILGVIVKLALEQLFPILPFAVLEVRALGVMTPALIANSCGKQGFRYTVPATLLATYVTFAAVTLLFWIF